MFLFSDFILWSRYSTERNMGGQRSHCSENKHSTWRQEFLGRGSENLEQSIPASLRQPDIEFGHFKRLLKAFLFGETAAH